MRFFNRLSLAGRIALTTVAASLISAALLLVIAYDRLVDDFERVLQDRQTLETRSYALQIDEALTNRLDGLALLAAQMTDGERLRPLPDLRQLLVRQTLTNRLFPDGLLVLDASATAIAQSVFVPGRLGTAYGDRRHIQRAMATGEPVISHPIIGRAMGRPLLSFVAPITSTGGQVLGLLVGVIELGREALLPHPEVASEGVVFKVLDTGTFTEVDSLVHGRPMKDLPAPGVDPLIDMALSGTSAGVVRGADGQPWIFATQYLERVGWLLLRAVPFDRAIAPARASFQQFLTVSVLVMAGVVVIALFLSGAVSRPLDRMSRRIRDWMATPTEALRLDPSGPPEVRNLASAFNQLMAERDSVDELKDRFVATVSHELRTPLTAIGGALKLLDAGATGGLPPKAAKLVDVALRNSDQLQRLVSDLLDFNRAAGGQLVVVATTVPVEELVESVCLGNRTTAAARGVRLVRGATSPLAVTADPHRLRQILDNFVSNALKFSPSGGHVTLSATLSGPGRVRLTVADQGPGVPVAFVPRLFERFSQAEPNTERGLAGTGLGLAICHELASLMAGRVGYTFESGAQFWVELPKAPLPNQEPEPDAESDRRD